MNRDEYLAQATTFPPNATFRECLGWAWEVDYEGASFDAARQFVWPHRAPGDPAPTPTLVPPAIPWSGDFLDALNGFQRPTFMLGGMPPADQDALLAAYPGTHVPVAPACDYPAFPQWHYALGPEAYRELIGRILRHGKRPVCVLHPRAEDSVTAHVARMDPYLQALQTGVANPALLSWQWGWEINDLSDDWARGAQQIAYVRRLRQRIPIGDLWAHWTPERWSCYPSYGVSQDVADEEPGEFDGLRQLAAAGLSGVLYQLPLDVPLRHGDPDQGEGALDRYLDYDQKTYQSPGILGRVLTAGLWCVCFEHARTPDRYHAVVSALRAEPRGQGWC